MVRRTVDASSAEVWATLSDFAGYGRWIPLTTMVIDPAPVRVGWAFAGRTGLGSLGFVDSMIVTRWEPPNGHAGDGEGGGADGDGDDDGVDEARFTVRKTGRLLRGWADITLRRRADGGTDVTWAEEIILGPERLGRRIAPLVDPVVARLFARALDQMLAATPGRGR